MPEKTLYMQRVDVDWDRVDELDRSGVASALLRHKIALYAELVPDGNRYEYEVPVDRGSIPKAIFEEVYQSTGLSDSDGHGGRSAPGSNSRGDAMKFMNAKGWMGKKTDSGIWIAAHDGLGIVLEADSEDELIEAMLEALVLLVVDHKEEEKKLLAKADRAQELLESARAQLKRTQDDRDNLLRTLAEIRYSVETMTSNSMSGVTADKFKEAVLWEFDRHSPTAPPTRTAITPTEDRLLVMQWHITRLRQHGAPTHIPCRDGLIEFEPDVRPEIKIGTTMRKPPRCIEDVVGHLTLHVQSSLDEKMAAGYGDRIIIEKDPEHPEMVNVFVDAGGTGGAAHPDPTPTPSEDP